MASGPFFFSQPFNEPKRKYKFFVEFQGGENNHSLSYFFPNGEYQWFIKSCTKPSIKVEVTPREETISIFNTPVATRRINEGATWNPIAIKFVNPYSHTFKPAIQNLENTDDYRKAVDLDHFFSNVMSSINANFGGNFIVEAPAGTPKVFENDEYLLLEYENTLDAVKLIEFGQLPRKDRVAKALKELNATIAPQTKDKGTISNNSCKGTAAISAVCKFNKFFGSIKIWDLGNGYFTLDEAKK